MKTCCCICNEEKDEFECVEIVNNAQLESALESVIVCKGCMAWSLRKMKQRKSRGGLLRVSFARGAVIIRERK